MRKRLSAKTSVLAAILAVSISSTTFAAQIPVINVTGSGSYTNSVSLLTDGFIPANGTGWTSDTNVYWNGTVPTFTLKFNGVYNVNDLLIQVDNNDDYRIDYSLNGSDWTTLYTISSSLGSVGYGMDTFTQADMLFSPFTAQYIRVQATGGDNMYAISEIQAFGTAVVPEPGTLALFGTGLLLSRVFRKREESL
jgi:hypothetical protein